MIKNCILAIIFILIITYPLSLSLKVLDDVWYENPYIDEMFWIPASNIAFEDFFIHGDFSQETWDQEYYTWGNYNPTIGKFIMGFFIHWRGDNQWREFPVKEGTKELKDRINFPTVETFVAARLPSFIFAYLSCFLLFFIVYLCVGFKEGVLAAILFVYNPIVRFVSHLALTDFYVIFFGLLSTLFFILLIKGINKKSFPIVLGIYTPAVGVFIGLCIGCKLSGFLCLINIAVLLIIAWFFSFDLPWLSGKFKSIQIFNLKPHSRWMFPSVLILTMAISFSIFIFSNPFLYRNTLHNLRHMYSHKSFLEKYDISQNLSLKEKFTIALGKRLLGDYHILHFRKFHRLSILLNFILTAIGLGYFPILIMRDIGNRDYSNANIKIVLLSWCIIHLGGTLWWVPKDWYRLLLPAILPLIVLESIGIIYTCRYGASLIGKSTYFINLKETC